VPVNNGKLLLPTHPFSVIATGIAEKYGPTAGLTGLATLLKIPLQNGPLIQGIIEATLLRDGTAKQSPQILEKFLSDIVSNNQPRIERAITALTEKTADASTVLQATKSEMDKFIAEKTANWTDISARITDEVDAAIKSIKGTEAAYRSQMELQASVDYWSDKAKKHGIAMRHAQNVLLIFSAVGGTLLLAFLIGLSVLASSVAAGELAIYLKFAAVGAIAVTIVFWGARILLRIFLSERHLATDADERITMVKTFLALANEKQIDPGDRALVLTPLFRSAADGIVRDDGPDASLAGILARAVDLKAKP
jgi:hypothetical protein